MITIDDLIKYTENPTRHTVEDRLSQLKDKDILIYGAGSFGKEMLSLLKEHKINVSAFLDRNADKIKSLDNIPVCTLDNYDMDKTDKLVIFSIVCDKDIRKKIINEIHSKGFTDVIEAQSIRCLQVDFDRNYDKENISEKIRKAYDLLSDRKSRQIYLNNIYAHLSGDYSQCNKYENNMSEQYFPDDIEFIKDYSVFIDCGGFVGDTISELLKRYKAETVVSFEPFIENYKKMVDFCKEQENDVNFFLFNNAVSNEISQCSFMTGTGSGSISTSGDVTITTVTIDGACCGIKPTFIKMDIEGSEMNAIIGAENTIRKNAPDLAICVYHKIEDIWKLPLKINSLYSDYNFYLRSYNSCTMETVLYALKKEKK